jgi:hypothetical protein
MLLLLLMLMGQGNHPSGVCTAAWLRQMEETSPWTTQGVGGCNYP